MMVKNLMKLIGILFKGKGLGINITFKELHEKTNVTLTIVGCCLNKTKEVHFSHITHPEMEVLKAIRISTSIPFFIIQLSLKMTYMLMEEL